MLICAQACCGCLVVAKIVVGVARVKLPQHFKLFDLGALFADHIGKPAAGLLGGDAFLAEVLHDNIAFRADPAGQDKRRSQVCRPQREFEIDDFCG